MAFTTHGKILSLVLSIFLITTSITATDLTLEEKVGQLFFVSLDMANPNPDMLDLIETHAIGGVMLHGNQPQNKAAILDLTKKLHLLSKKASNNPIFIAIDQEGGRVNRLKKDFTHFRSNQEVGQTQSPYLAKSIGKKMAIELRSVGINMNFAPVLDTNTNTKNTVISDRSYGSDPDLVANLGVAFIEGLQTNGILAIGKHFPGHGSTTKDSHQQLPLVTKTNRHLEYSDMAPFRAAIRHHVAGIMTAHVRYSALDKAKPATLSYPILTTLLRKDLNFKGLIISDDLNMGAIKNQVPLDIAAVSAIQAGVDMVLLLNNPLKIKQCYNAVLRAVQTNKISMKRLDEAVFRVLEAKKGLKLTL